MNWKLWNREKEEKKDSRIQHLQAEVANLNMQLDSLNDHIKKMTRMQFKSSKNLQEKLDGFESALTSLNKQHDLIGRYEKDRGRVIEQMICWRVPLLTKLKKTWN